MNTLRAGVIGLGKKGLLYDLDNHLHNGPQTHVCAFEISDHTELVAVCDEDSKKLIQCEQAFPSICTYDTLDEMLNVANLDILSIATPVETHADIVKRTTRHRKIKVIFVEKPIAPTIQEAKAMIKSCERHNIKLIVNHQRRWNPNWLTAHSNLASIGPLRLMIGYCSGDPLEAGTHMADLFRWFGSGIPHHYVNMMHKQPYEPYLVFELDIFGDNGRITVSDNGRKISLFSVEESKEHKGIKELVFQRNPAPRTLYMPMLGAVKHLANVASGIEEPVSSGHDGLRALELALKWIE